MGINKTAIIILFIALIYIVIPQKTNAQQWVADMQDTSLTLKQQQESFNTYWANREYEKGHGYKQFKRNEHFLLNIIGSDGKPQLDNHRIDDYKKIKQQMAATKSIGTAGKWVHLGPNGPSSGIGAGRTNCIDFHPTDANKIIVGAPSGGIWRSNNGGSSWTTNTDDLASIGISDIKYAPSNANILYAATGDIDGNNTYSTGILKSTDGGNTWTTTGLNYQYNMKRKTFRILIHPTNPDIVYATTNTGLFKTTDGGSNWNRVKLGSYKDIEFKPGDPNTIFLASSNKIFKSTNAGSTYTIIKSIGGSNRIELAVTANDANYIYALCSKASNNGFNGLYQSTDGGSTFSKKSSSPNILGWKKNGSGSDGQGYYDLSLAVSPSNKNKLFVGGVNMWTSNNGGSTWSMAAFWIAGTGVPYVHADIHTIKYSPHNSNKIWACTDGGLSFSSNNGTGWIEKNNKLAIAQMYRLGGSKTNANIILTGWQDNGSSLMTNSWKFVLGGDGMECIVSHSDNTVMYASLYNGDIRRSYNGGNSWQQISGAITEPGAWVTPYIMDYNNSNILLAGYVNVWKTTNKGNSWTKISNWSGPITLNALASAGVNSSVIWTANSQTLRKSYNGGQSWTSITTNLGSGKVNSIAINKADPNKVWVCKSGFYDGQKVYQTLDGGATWTNISFSLPNYPVNSIINAPNTTNGLYVGTDMGVYYYDTVLNDWIPFMKDLPNVIVKELELFEQGNKIRAATYGRGLWESVTYPYANSVKNSTTNELGANIYPNPASSTVYIKFNTNVQKNTKLTIFNNIGMKIDENITLNSNINHINTSNYPKGVYLFKISSETQSSVFKVIIE